MTHAIAPIFNFLLFIGLMYFVGRKSVPQMFEQRSADVKAQLSSVGAVLKSAEVEFNEYSNRLRGLSGEIEQIRNEIASETKKEVDSIRLEGVRTVEAISQDASRAVARVYAEAKRDLYLAAAGKILTEATVSAKAKLGNASTSVGEFFSKVEAPKL